jgi:hypothetical protein
MTAIGRSLVKLWVVASGTAPSALSTNVWSTSNTAGYIPGQIKSYTKSGGEIDTKSDAVFGGFVDIETPASPYEIEFTLVPALEASSYEWEKLAYNLDSTSGTAVYTSKGVSLGDQAFFIQATDGVNNKSWGFNNCNVVMLDQEHNADQNLGQKLKLKLSPTDASGIPNYQYSKQAVTSLKVWSSLSTS